MTTEQIEYFLKNNPLKSGRSASITFKKRNAIQGLFIEASDFSELKKRNFWRIVAAGRMEEYLQSKDINLSRIFNGDEFSKLNAEK